MLLNCRETLCQFKLAFLGLPYAIHSFPMFLRRGEGNNWRKLSDTGLEKCLTVEWPKQLKIISRLFVSLGFIIYSFIISSLRIPLRSIVGKRVFASLYSEVI